MLIAVSTLSAALAACSGEASGPSVVAGAGANGMAGAAGLAGMGAGGMAGSNGLLPPGMCTPGAPASSQIPRSEPAVRSGVRDLSASPAWHDEKAVSELLVDDSDGPMTPDAWRIYLDVGEQIAGAVMSGPNKSRFISCDPATAGCLDETIRSFGRKAFRRPLTDAEVTRFQKLSQTTPAGAPDEVAETTLLAFLVSPSFILVPELAMTADPTGQGVQLSGHEVATRLSLLLWGSIPDDTLNAAADADQLQTKEQILAEAQR